MINRLRAAKQHCCLAARNLFIIKVAERIFCLFIIIFCFRIIRNKQKICSATRVKQGNVNEA